MTILIPSQQTNNDSIISEFLNEPICVSTHTIISI